MFYDDYQRNHVVLPGREKALHNFLNQEHNGRRHKWQHRCNSNSEDALTWSCFEVLDSLPLENKVAALAEVFEDAYDGQNTALVADGEWKNDDIQIYVGKEYIGSSTGESTEVDASIELSDKLIFIEAKLYSAVSMASPPATTRDQIARKLRVGLDSPLQTARELFFIFLDIAPYEKLYRRGNEAEVKQSKSSGFHDKWKSAWLFKHYKCAKNPAKGPLVKALEGLATPPVESVAANMGWLTWGDLFKSILRQAALK